MSAPRDEKYFIDEGGGARNAFEKLQQKNPAQENREKNTLGKRASANCDLDRNILYKLRLQKCSFSGKLLTLYISPTHPFLLSKRMVDKDW